MRFAFSLAAVLTLVAWTGTAAAGRNKCKNGNCGAQATTTAFYTYEVVPPPPVPAAPMVVRSHELPPAAPPVAPAPSVAAGCNASAVTAGCSASASQGCSERRGGFKFKLRKKIRGCGE
jgi:hypothetical protein